MKRLFLAAVTGTVVLVAARWVFRLLPPTSAPNPNRPPASSRSLRNVRLLLIEAMAVIRIM